MGDMNPDLKVGAMNISALRADGLWKIVSDMRGFFLWDIKDNWDIGDTNGLLAVGKNMAHPDTVGMPCSQ